MRGKLQKLSIFPPLQHFGIKTNMSRQLQIESGLLERVECIAKGGYGEVWKCKWKIPPPSGDFFVAVKYITSSHKSKQQAEEVVLKEVNGMLPFKNQEHIVQVVGYCYDTHSKNTFGIVMEFVQPPLLSPNTKDSPYRATNLFEFLQQSQDARFRDLSFQFELMIQATEALSAVHSQKMIHRDVKSSNFLLTKDWKLKLCDFGLTSRIDSYHSMSTSAVIGTIRYMAPELFYKGTTHTISTDIYGLATVFYEILHHQTPFLGDDAEMTIITEVVQGKRPPINCSFPTELGQLLNAMWNQDPSQRPSTKQILKQLNTILLFYFPPKDSNIQKIRYIVSGSEAGTVRVWNWNTKLCIGLFQGHTGDVRAVLPWDQSRVISGGMDKTIRVWNLESRKCEHQFAHLHSWVSCFLKVDENRFLSGSGDGTMKIWNMQTKSCELTWRAHQGCVRCVALMPSRTVISGGDDKTLKKWDISTGDCLLTLETKHYDIISCVAVVNDQLVASGSCDNLIKLWDLTSQTCISNPYGHTNWIRSILPWNQTLLISASADYTITIWNWKSNTRERVIKNDSAVWSLAKMDDNTVVTGDAENVKVWDVETENCVHIWKGYQEKNIWSLGVL